ncbi:MAG: IclR family transcriptional regulator [Oscillospiraceae bacterium]|nr:IclR family transcriptional regulator [Oscillospiraceae bacterium]
MSAENSSVQCLERAFDIVGIICEKGTGVGITEIAQRLELPKSTVHRIMQTLHAKGYVYHNKKGRVYSLGVEALKLGFSAAEHLPMVSRAKPHMEYLSQKYSEYVVLAVMRNNSIFIITNYMGSYSTTFFSNDQQTHNNDSYRPAVMHCIMAYNNKEKNKHYLEKYLQNQKHRGLTKKAIYTIDAFEERLQKVRERGYDIEDGEFRDDEVCYAVPITGMDGSVEAALSIFGTRNRILQFRAEDILRDLKLSSDNISQQK